MSANFSSCASLRRLQSPESRQSRQPCRHVAIAMSSSPSLPSTENTTRWMSSISLGTNTWTGWSRDGFLHLSNRPPADAGVLIGLGMPCMRLRVADARILTLSGCATRRSGKRMEKRPRRLAVPCFSSEQGGPARRGKEEGGVVVSRLSEHFWWQNGAGSDVGLLQTVTVEKFQRRAA